MTIHVLDRATNLTVPVATRENDDEEHVPGHDVLSLPAEVTADIAAIKGHVDGIESALSALGGYLDTVETKLQSIIDAQAVPSGGPKFGYKGGISTTQNFASKPLTRGLVVINLDATNNLLISMGTPAVADADTLVVLPKMASPFIACSNANLLNMQSSAGTIAATYAGA